MFLKCPFMLCSCFISDMHDGCLYLQYAFLDIGMPQQEVYLQSLQVNQRAMEMLVHEVQLKWFAEQKVALFKNEFQATKSQLNSALQQQEIVQASFRCVRDFKY